ncbi:hypothetical protein ACIP98_13435 [Streptomyces sp. NPDC088354]|uniref:hypothetical protein n=1 Tax=Streptomyces sp. NPDC088354 TaxID=3365856 RepID=UPI00381F807C
MTDGASPAPHADPALARDCTYCRGWGTIITDLGRHELCPHCQPVGEQPAPAPQPSDARPPAGARYASPSGPVATI